MRNSIRYALIMGMVYFFTGTQTLWANTVNSSKNTIVSGQVLDENGIPLVGVNVQLKGKVVGTSTDAEGKFMLDIKHVPPITLVFSMIGFRTQEVDVYDQEKLDLVVTMVEETLTFSDVVVSASRVEESRLESPVSIEKMDLLSIENTASAQFYDGLADLKGVQLTTSSLTFKSVNTRGFATIANERFVQLIDGVDNAAPGLNFPAGNFIGASELDVESVEIVPGAASALYGPNAFNGILIMNTKSPFFYKGLSFYGRTGVTDAKQPGTNEFYDVAIRYANTITPKLAFKVNFAYLAGDDWQATNYDDQDTHPLNAGITGSTSPSYDGLNIYGDEIATTLNLSDYGLGSIRVARTGYKETDLIDYDTESIKAVAALHYLINDDIEAIYDYRIGSGTTIYQGGNRYSLNNIILQQHKLELNGSNFFVRAYVSIEDAGDSYDSRFAGWNINRAWSADETWFTEYAGAYVQTIYGGGTEEQAHAAARAYADRNRLIPGTPEFGAVKKEILEKADLRTGSKFIDKSTMQHIEGNYDLSERIKFAQIQIGGNYRRYLLNSEGTLFNDGPNGVSDIDINEFGAYMQASKAFVEDKLKLSASVRFDKNENFDGQFSPRASAVYQLDNDGTHFIRTSYQTGFRNPATQSQYIALDLGVATLVGGVKDNIDNYTLDVYGDGSLIFTGDELYNNSYTQSSVEAFAATGDVTVLEASDIAYVKPEQIQTVEVGYRGIFEQKLSIDFNVYYSSYDDFQANTNVLVPNTGDVNDHTTWSGAQDIATGQYKVFQLYSNASGKVTSWGMGVDLSYNLPANYVVSGNYNYADFEIDDDANPDLIPGFNTPKHRFGASVSNRNVYNNIGFNITTRWSDSYKWEASFGDGNIDSYTVTDLQITYSIRKYNAFVKFGGANIFNQEYIQAHGAPSVGAQYYVSIQFNNLLN